MSRSRDIDPILDRWMDDGPTVVADRVIAGAMTEIQTTRQRGARRASLRDLFMTMKPAAMVAGLAAVIIIGIATYRLIPGGSPRIGATPSLATAPDLGPIVVTDGNAPEGLAVATTLRGPDALDHLIRYGEPRDATPGFVDGRATDFCTADQECGTSWVALYRSDADADAAFSLFHGEMIVGWGIGTDPEALDFGEDEGYAYRNNMGGPHRQAYVWRQGNLVLGVLGVAELGDSIRSIAEEMDARSR
jgi:hypothetical protein